MSRDDPKWTVGEELSRTPEESPMTREETPATKSQPFDANPRPLEPAQNGWVFCETCQAPKPAEGHEHSTGIDLEILSWKPRAEYAESLLCAMAFDHQRDFPHTRREGR